jgi:hypothetical protein
MRRSWAVQRHPPIVIECRACPAGVDMDAARRDPQAVAHALEEAHHDAERLRAKAAHGGHPGEEAVDTSAELRQVRCEGRLGGGSAGARRGLGGGLARATTLAGLRGAWGGGLAGAWRVAASCAVQPAALGLLARAERGLQRGPSTSPPHRPRPRPRPRPLCRAWPAASPSRRAPRRRTRRRPPAPTRPPPRPGAPPPPPPPTHLPGPQRPGAPCRAGRRRRATARRRRCPA